MSKVKYARFYGSKNTIIPDSKYIEIKDEVDPQIKLLLPVYPLFLISKNKDYNDLTLLTTTIQTKDITEGFDLLWERGSKYV